MIGKEQIRDMLLKECDICLHLFEKIPADSYDHRPTEGQRTLGELLTYISYCAIGGTRTMATGSWDAYREVAQRAAGQTPEQFPEAMQRQKDELTSFFDDITQEQLDTQEAESPLGEKMPLDVAITTMPLHWMVAYRMQLFLYIKQAGNEEIWTPNCWGGIDMERPQAAGA